MIKNQKLKWQAVNNFNMLDIFVNITAATI